MRSASRLAVALVATTVLSGCVSGAPTIDAYEAKAALTADDATSSVRTAVLAVSTYETGDLPSAYLEVMLVESERAVAAVQATFDSVQPPESARADEIRHELDALLASGSSGLIELRIAARRDRPGELSSTAISLARIASDLEAFGRAHSR